MTDKGNARETSKDQAAPAAGVKPEEPSATAGAATSVEHIAPRDPYETGGQKQDQQHELKQSVSRGEREADPGQSAGQHRTGSYTGTSGGQKSGS